MEELLKAFDYDEQKIARLARAIMLLKKHGYGVLQIRIVKGRIRFYTPGPEIDLDKPED